MLYRGWPEFVRLPFHYPGFHSITLISMLWFLAVFAFRLAVAFLELFPRLSSIETNFQLSPRLELLTWHTFLASLIIALALGPITHYAITRAAVFKIYHDAMMGELSNEDVRPEKPENDHIS